jgi:hypothetical protein
MNYAKLQIRTPSVDLVVQLAHDFILLMRIRAVGTAVGNSDRPEKLKGGSSLPARQRGLNNKQSLFADLKRFHAEIMLALTTVVRFFADRADFHETSTERTVPVQPTYKQLQTIWHFLSFVTVV